MAHIKLLQADHSKSIQKERVTYLMDSLVSEALRLRTKEIREEYELLQYGIGNYILSLAMHDPNFRQIIKQLRKEAKANGRQYHRERQLDPDDIDTED